MSDDRIVISSGSALSPETVANRSFANSFRGFDQAEVKMFLKRVSEELEAAAQREAELRRSLHEAMARAAHPEIDEEILTNALGEHTARLLTNARETAAAIVSDAETRAARMLQEGEGRIARMRAEAETLLSRRAEEAERLASGLRQAADSDARTLRERARADAQAEVEAARSQGREMVGEAKELRERMLTDLLRRRRLAEAHIEQMRLAHQRLLQAYGVVRRTLEEATGELSAAEADTRPVMEALRARAEPSDQHPPDGGDEQAPQRPRFSPEISLRPPSGSGVGRRPPPAEAETPPPVPDAPLPEAAPVGHDEPDPVAKDKPRYDLPPPADDPAGVGALGAGTEAVAPDARPADTGPGEPEAEAGPGATGEGDPPSDQPVSAVPTGGPGPAPPSPWPHRPARAVRETAQPASAQVEELFARLRAAQRRRDSADAAAASSEAAEGSGGQDAGAPAEVSPPVDAEPGAGGPSTAGPDVTDEKALYRRYEVLDPIDSDLSRRLKRVLQDEQNEVLDRLRRQRQPVAESTLPELVKQTESYQTAAAPLLRQAARAGASLVAGLTPPEPDGVSDESADRWAAELAIELIVPLRERVERALNEGVSQAGGQAGADGDEVAKGDEVGADESVGERISASYRQWKLQHVEQIARHHSSAAFTRGAFAAIANGTTLRWVVDDEGPCPDCEDNALAGPTPKGEAFPTGQTHPPAHPGCRCLLVPVGV